MAILDVTEENALISTLEQAANDYIEQLEDRIAKMDLPVGTRQILSVQKYAMYTANSIDSSANPVVSAQAYIAVSGVPTPSSDVTSGYIRFVDASKLRVPSYTKARKLINIYVDYRSMPQVLEQLTHNNRYLWVGHFSGGHIYGDLHSSP